MNNTRKILESPIKDLFYCLQEGIPVRGGVNTEIDEDVLILFEVISENSNNFTRDISKKVLDHKYSLSDKQTWCLCYQLKNNLDMYRTKVDELYNQKVC
jgi:hypothetical protein